MQTVNQTLKNLIDMFVDETPLSKTDIAFLAEHSCITEIYAGAWQLTEKGKKFLT